MKSIENIGAFVSEMGEELLRERQTLRASLDRDILLTAIAYERYCVCEAAVKLAEAHAHYRQVRDECLAALNAMGGDGDGPSGIKASNL